MKWGIAAVFLVAFLVVVPFVLGADGDPITVTSQSPPDEYIITEEDDVITLAFIFTGDYANCSFYGNWSGGWDEKMILDNRTPGNYDIDVPIVLFDCNEAYLWNVFCVEDNDSANYDWGENRTFVFECEEEPPEVPPSGNSYSVILDNPWEGELNVGDRWLFSVGEDRHSLILKNVTANSTILQLTPSGANFTISFLGSVSIDADGNGTYDLTVRMKRLYAWTKALFLLSEFGYNETEPEDNTTQYNETMNETINDTLSNVTGQNITGYNQSIDNVTNQTAGNDTLNITGNVSTGDNVTLPQNVSNQISNQTVQTPPESSKEGLPVWIIMLILMIVVVIVVYFAYNMLGPPMA